MLKTTGKFIFMFLHGLLILITYIIFSIFYIRFDKGLSRVVKASVLTYIIIMELFTCGLISDLHIEYSTVIHDTKCFNTGQFIIMINTVSVMFDNYDWRMMLKLLGVSSYRRRIKADRKVERWS